MLTNLTFTVIRFINILSSLMYRVWISSYENINLMVLPNGVEEINISSFQLFVLPFITGR